ncbi:GMP synthase [Shewanella sp. UCD-KL12]|uniref:glutamine amidotransferase-related protein n=1 Tax=Shewanella sp. UCD-KL12 TaxID=1917163 RepID=UPI0009705AA4|nr:GMP synthase [Shewanella sp. UCD-KL12]
MNIGILQCDDVTEALQDKHGNYPEMFARLFNSVEEHLEFSTYRVIDGEFPESIDICDAYITTGSRYGANDSYEWIQELQTFICQLHHARKKLIGICFGHQMMAKALGGTVEKSSKGWGVGINTSRVTHTEEWMERGHNEISLVVSHQDQVKQLPPGAVILAASEFCPHYMMQINQHFIGIQGHPEFSKLYSKDLMNARRDRIPHERIESGIESLSLSVDDKLVTQWLINFLK